MLNSTMKARLVLKDAYLRQLTTQTFKASNLESLAHHTLQQLIAGEFGENTEVVEVFVDDCFFIRFMRSYARPCVAARASGAPERLQIVRRSHRPTPKQLTLSL